MNARKPNAAPSLQQVPQRPGGLQANSYVATTYLAHALLKNSVESDKFGDGRSRIIRALRDRVMDSGAPMMGMSNGRSQFNGDGTVKRRPGLLKGVLPGPHWVPAT